MTTWNPAQLTGFGAGSVARKALSMLFQSLSERLPADVFETKLVMPESAWPRLEIGKKGWERIFGDGYNYNVFLWFKVPGIWDATEHSFYPEIQLWTKNHGNDWNATRPKLMAWTKTLAKANFSHWVDGRGFPGHFDLTQQEIVGVPRRILATLDDLKIDEATLRTLTDHELILALEKMVIRYCDAVEQLG